MQDVKKVYIETYGCQMNLNDTEIIFSIMNEAGFEKTESPLEADCIFLNTCSVRDNAEQRIYKRLTHLKQYKKQNRKLVVGILGCMAERLRKDLMGKQDLVTLVIGPDEYRSLPHLVNKAMHGDQGIAVKLSRVETYDDIEPLRSEGISAWLSIMRGCNNFCTYCVVPYTRGRERSRPMMSLVNEVERLYRDGFKEITLLGQNVNSYSDPETQSDFSDLLEKCAIAVPDMRIRYTTSHPKDFGDKLIETMAKFDNICNYIHLPVQSGSNRVLQLMDRGYTVEHYLNNIEKVKKAIPNISLSTDIIAGFPGETEEDHKLTLDLMAEVKYDGAFMFKYSPREGTKAFKMEDDVPDEIKLRRLNEIIDQQHSISRKLNEAEYGSIHEVLVESESKRDETQWQGRSDTNKVIIFPNEGMKYKQGDKVKVKIEKSTSATMFGQVVE